MSTTTDTAMDSEHPSEASRLIDYQAHETAATMIRDLATSSRRNSPRIRTTPRNSQGLGAPASAASNAIFSCIGLGIVNDFNVESEDATEAAIKALKDAAERSGMGFHTAGQHLVLSVRVGVPGRSKHPNRPMHVDVAHLTPLLPPSVSLSRLEVIIGGLLSPTSNTNPVGVCTAVACLSFFQEGSVGREEPVPNSYPFPAGSPTSVGEEPGPAVPIVSASGKQLNPVPIAAARPTLPSESLSALAPQSPDSSQDHESWNESSGEMPQSSRSMPSHVARPLPVHRTNSIEMLARISSEIREQEPEDPNLQAAHNYKKLPPGKTPKNNKRLFVQHEYHDFSQATPSVGEEFLMRSDAPLRTPNAAFPLKLHETLTGIEQDGLDDIIGWMSHGRSFKIHKQAEFVNEILPKYFVMTKKSSFLRQLNLYGFNRLSGSGPDQGSYYHEKFLRGMKFLCRRMQRCKVNGNGIRAAGNPDDEPNFVILPSCPADEAPRSPGLPLSDQEEGSGDGFNSIDSLRTGPTSLPSLSSELHGEASNGFSQVETSVMSRVIKPVNNQQHSFPLRLQRMLDKLEAEGSQLIVSWLPHGRAFVVHDADRFVAELMPAYFNQTKYSSFQRQLHMYNFCRITTGRDKGAYWNVHFQRGKPSLTVHMPRTRVNGKGTRRPAVPEMEPDLWKEPPLPPIKPGTTVMVPTMLGAPLASRRYSPGSDGEDNSDQES